MTAAASGEREMRIARYYDNRSVRVETAERPGIGDGEVLVRVMACGICGSDALEWFRVPKAPRILGHEISGVVARSRSDRYREGDRVVVRNQVPCGRCYACEHGHHAVCEDQVEIGPGGMAEYVRVPTEVVAAGMWPLAAALSFAQGALAEPLACVLHSQRLAGIAAHHGVLVLGCGAFGLMHLQVARAAGVSRIVAVDGIVHRRQVAAEWGAATLSPGEDVAAAVRAANGGRLADLVIVATGAADALATASSAVARHGTVLLFGAPDPDVALPISLNQLFWRRELTVVSSYGAGDVDFAESLALIEDGLVDPDRIISHVVPLSEVQKGFDLVTNPQESIKVVLDVAR